MKKVIFAFVIIGVLFCCLPFAFADIGTYGVDLNSSAYNAQNPFNNGLCTWYAWGRANEKLGVKLPFNGGHSDAMYWADNARNAGLLVDTTPYSNSVAVWTSGEYGHVAFVEEFKNNAIYITEANHAGTLYSEGYIRLSDGHYQNTSGNCNSYDSRGVPNYYIHFNGVNQRPIGEVTNITGDAGCVTVSGSAYDPDEPSKSLEIHVYIGGAAGNPNAKSYGGFYTNSSTRQFSFTVNTDLTGVQPIYLYALDTQGGDNPEIGHGTVNIASQMELDVNGWLDNSLCGDVSGYATFDVYINGTRVANDVNDFCQKVDYGSVYEIKDIKVVGGKAFDGYSNVARDNFVSSGRTGTLTANKDIRLSIHTVNAAAFIRNHLPVKTAVYNGHSYYFYNIPVTWYEAEIISKHLGGHLVSITSADENNFAKSLAGDSSCWIGATDSESEGRWKWTSGEAFTYSNWRSGEPNNDQGDEGAENFTHIAGDGSDWNDAPGNVCYPFICEIDRAYTITYNSNNGSSAPAKQDKAVKQGIKLSSTIPVRNGYEFAGWATSIDATTAQYHPGDTYSADASVTLYAFWVVTINEKNFPDSVFRDFVKAFDKNGDGKLSISECASVKQIDLQSEGIYSLKGIEFFTNLTYLDCSFNNLKVLDVSNNAALTELGCSENDLAELDVSWNTALTKLFCCSNILTELDVSKNKALTYLYCDNNELTELDVSNNIALTHLECFANALTELDVSNNTALISLSCEDNALTELNMNNDTELLYLHCDANALTELDVSDNTALAELRCSHNFLTELDVSNNTALWYLLCNNNALTDLDVSRNPVLSDLFCNNNSLMELDVSKNAELTYLYCDNNQLTELDISNNPLLEVLQCDSNHLTKLNLTHNPELTNISSNQSIITQAIYANNKTAYEIGMGFDSVKFGTGVYDAKTGMLRFDGTVAEFSYGFPTGYNGILMDVIVQAENLPETGIEISTTNFPDELFRAYVSDNFDTDTDGYLSEEEIAEVNVMTLTYEEMTFSAQGLEYFTALQELTVYVTDLSSLDISANSKLESLTLTTEGQEWGPLTSLVIGNQPCLKELYIGFTKMESLDLSGCSALETLSFRDNYYLSSVNLGGCPLIEEVSCYHNHSLTSLDLSGNPALKYLDCHENDSLASLDIAECEELRMLACSYDALASLDIGGCSKLRYLDCHGNTLTTLNISNCSDLLLSVRIGEIKEDEDEGYREYSYMDETTWDEFYLCVDMDILLDNLPIFSFILPDSLTIIEEEAFMGVPATSVRIPDGAKSIGSKAFADCPYLRTIYIPSSVTVIADNAFSGVTGLAIYGQKGSLAATFAKTHGFRFVEYDGK